MEIEIKVAVDEAAAVVRRLEEFGATLEQSRSFEDNVLLDRPDRELTRAGRLLRVREFAGRSILTAKAPAADEREGFKVRREEESIVPDGATMRAALEDAGFETLWRYQKWRTVYRWRSTEIVVDETPAGAFLEVEGEPADIDRVAAELDVDPARRLTGTYRDVWEAWCERHGEPVGDMVFPEEDR